MKSSSLIVLGLLFWAFTMAQTSDKWVAFQSTDKQSVGFKDAQGNVKIPLKFTGFLIASEFENIMAVVEQKQDDYAFYYLTKSGRQVGKDSFWMFDLTPDCESEGFIRFKDRKTDKVGLFDKNGNVAIPALYDGLSMAQNGFVQALKGAEKKYWDDHKEADCHHFRLIGGTEYLLNVRNEVLIEDFSFEGHLDFYSLVIKFHPMADSRYQSFKGVDGKYYSFIHMEKDFGKWFRNDLMPHLSPNRLKTCTYDSVTYHIKGRHQMKASKSTFVANNYEQVAVRLHNAIKPNAKFSLYTDHVSWDELNGKMKKLYFNNCRQPQTWKYPVIRLMVARNETQVFNLDEFKFLKTASGYQLISVDIKGDE